MNTLPCEQLMEIIVQLDTSYTKEIMNKELEGECLKGLLLANEYGSKVMVDYAKCAVCTELVYDYNVSDDNYFLNPKIHKNIHNCGICDKKICISCSINLCCPKCWEIRDIVDEICISVYKTKNPK